ncbi:MAG: Mu transposase C-terminal domain-containing protein, partial [Gemmatimonadales bacterium]
EDDMRLDIPEHSLVQLKGTIHRFTHWTTADNLVFRDPQNGDTIQCTQEQLLRLYSDGLANLNVPPPDTTEPWRTEILQSDFVALPEHLRAEALRRQMYLDRVREVDPVGPHKITYPPIIHTVHDEIDDKKDEPSWQSVRRWMLNYQKARYDVRALVPGYAHRGRKWMLLSQEEQKILVECAQAWLNDAKPTKQYFVGLVDTAYRQAVGVVPGAWHWKVPCRSTLYAFLDRIDPYEAVARRHGSRAADEKFKPVDRKRPPRHRLERVEIDHTVLDIYVVDPVHRLILGRPTITAAIDVCTRMIVGLYIGFEPASTYSVIQCLRNMILPKTYVKDEWPDLRLTWNPYGIPFVVLVDNAVEFRGDAFRHIAQVLGMTVEQAPVKHPEFKGTVERFFRTLKDGALTGLAGKPIRPSDKPTEATPEDTACISLPQLRKLLHHWLIADYCNTTHTGIMDVPQRRWDAEDRTRPLRLPNSLADLDALLGYLEAGTLTREGIRFHNLFYKSELLRPILRAAGGSRDISFKYDPGNLARIHVIHPETRRPIPVPVQEQDFEYANGLTLFQHKAVLKFMRERNRAWENRDERLAAVDEFRAETMRLLKKGRVRTRGRHARMFADGVVQPRTDIAALLASIETESAQAAGTVTDAWDTAITEANARVFGGSGTSTPWPSGSNADLDGTFANASVHARSSPPIKSRRRPAQAAEQRGEAAWDERDGPKPLPVYRLPHGDSGNDDD